MRRHQDRNTRIWWEIAAALLLGGILLGTYLWTGRPPAETGEAAHRALLRWRGFMVLIVLACYGRFFLLPQLRWSVYWWLLLPGSAAIVCIAWPCIGWGPWLELARRLAVLMIILGLTEPGAALIRFCLTAVSDTIPARRQLLQSSKEQAASFCFLAALAIGTGLYLLSVDFLFDYLLYSLLGAVLVLIIYAFPLAVLAVRIESSLSVRLSALAAVEESALEMEPEKGVPILRHAGLARRALLAGALPCLRWWDWARAVGAGLLLLIAAVLREL